MKSSTVSSKELYVVINDAFPAHSPSFVEEVDERNATPAFEDARLVLPLTSPRRKTHGKAIYKNYRFSPVPYPVQFHLN